MTTPLNRRTFCLSAGVTSLGSLSLASSPVFTSHSANEKITLAVMGLNRGKALANLTVKLPNVSIKYVCDVDRKRAESVREFVEIEQPVAQAAHRFPQSSRRQRCRCDDLRTSQPLARTGDHHGMCCGETRLCREAVQSQPARRRDDGAGGEKTQPSRSNGGTTSQRIGNTKSDAGITRRDYWRSLSCTKLVRQRKRIHRQRKTGRCSRKSRLRSLAGACTARAVFR